MLKFEIEFYEEKGKNPKIILLHAIRKKTEKTPVPDKELAEKRMNDYIENKGD